MQNPCKRKLQATLNKNGEELAAKREKKRPTREITRREARARQAKTELFRKPFVLNIGTLIVLLLRIT